MREVMSMRSIALALLFLASVAAAVSVRPDYLGIKDTGNQSLPKLDVGIMIDCGSKAATVTVASNATGLAVVGARAYMFYTDYGYNALPNPGVTDSSGIAVMPVTGNIRYLTALFVLRVDDPSFQSREIEYTYQKCFQALPPQNSTTPPVQNQTNSTQPAQNDTNPPTQNNTMNATNTTSSPNVTITPPGNGTANASIPGSDNTTGNQTGQKAPPACPLPTALLALLFIRARR